MWSYAGEPAPAHDLSGLAALDVALALLAHDLGDEPQRPLILCQRILDLRRHFGVDLPMHHAVVFEFTELLRQHPFR